MFKKLPCTLQIELEDLAGGGGAVMVDGGGA